MGPWKWKESPPSPWQGHSKLRKRYFNSLRNKKTDSEWQLRFKQKSSVNWGQLLFVNPGTGKFW